MVHGSQCTFEAKKINLNLYAYYMWYCYLKVLPERAYFSEQLFGSG